MNFVKEVQYVWRIYMLKSDIKVGMKLELIDLREEAYMAVVELVKESCILVKIIVGNGEGPKIKQNYKNKILMYANGRVYSGETTMIGIRGEGECLRAILTIPEELEKIERRKYFRFPIEIDLDYVLIPKGEEYIQIKDIPKDYIYSMKGTNCIDISGGGIKIFIEEPAEIGQQVLISIFIPEELRILCTVARIEKDIEHKRYKAGLKFENINERSRDKIIEFIFQQVR